MNGKGQRRGSGTRVTGEQITRLGDEVAKLPIYCEADANVQMIVMRTRRPWAGANAYRHHTINSIYRVDLYTLEISPRILAGERGATAEYAGRRSKPVALNHARALGTGRKIKFLIRHFADFPDWRITTWRERA